AQMLLGRNKDNSAAKATMTPLINARSYLTLTAEKLKQLHEEQQTELHLAILQEIKKGQAKIPSSAVSSTFFHGSIKQRQHQIILIILNLAVKCSELLCCIL